MNTARKITFALTVAAEIICCFFLNIMGGFGFISNGYGKCGAALFVSTALLAAALVLAGFKRVILPLLFNIAGSGAYLYTIAVLNAIPAAKIPKENTEKLIANHLPTVSVTVLLFMLVFFNFMSEEAVKKRRDKKEAKKAAENRQLEDNEKIV